MDLEQLKLLEQHNPTKLELIKVVGELLGKAPCGVQQAAECLNDQVDLYMKQVAKQVSFYLLHPPPPGGQHPFTPL